MHQVVTPLALILVSAAIVSADDQTDRTAKFPPATLSVSIAIPVHHQRRSLNSTGHFHVLVTNTSETPQNVWTEKYSWGYFNLSFEVTDEQGNTTVIRKKNRGWSKNFPDFLTLAPGECYVLNVDLYGEGADAVWENVPARPKLGSHPRLIKMRALYNSATDEESKRLNVWTGSVASPVAEYAIW